MDAGLKRELEAKVYAGERLTRSDGIALQESDDLAWLGRLAHHKRTEMAGDRALFAVNRRLDLAEADELTGESAGGRLADQLTEVHIADAALPGRPWQFYPDALRRLRAALPGVGLRGFGALEIDSLEKASGLPAGDILDQLMSAGLDALSGDDGGAGDDQAAENDQSWQSWSRVHRLAHEKGMKTPASWRYGHLEGPEQRVDHLLRLRELQDETGGFAAFVPVRRKDGEAVAPAASLKIFAVSRLLLDNVPHIQASSATHQLSVAQLALNFGADELDVPAAGDKIQDDGDLLDLIWDAGFRPVRRDIRYAVVRTYDAAPSFTERRSEPQQVWA